MFHIDNFSAGLDALTIKQQSDPVAVLRVLERTGKFSCFEATENGTIAETMDRLENDKLITRTSDSYPWVHCELTEAGKRLIEAGK